jgi:hypothetical protein
VKLKIFNSKNLTLMLVLGMVLNVGFFSSSNIANAQEEEPEFTQDFRLEDCNFRASGENPYFILRPGYQLVFEGEEDGEQISLEITVLRATEEITLPDIGTVRTRVVEERESVDEELVEVSRNFFAICRPANDVYYFGEEVDIYNEDGTITHEGAWRAGEPDEDGLAEPGLLMPGTFLLGSRYFQEMADGIALDRAEHVEMGIEITTSAGTFSECVRVIETTPLEPDTESEKIYCPEVGLVLDDVVELVDYGFTGGNGSQNEDDDNE